MPITSFFNGFSSGEAAAWALMALVALLTLVQISPIRLNPWDSIFTWVGKKVNSAQVKQLELEMSSFVQSENTQKSVRYWY